MHLKIVEETEWESAGEVRDPSCPHHDNSLFWALSYCISVKACPVRHCDTCVCVLSANNVQFTVVSLYINVTFTRAFPFLHKGPSWQPVKFKIPNVYRRGGRVRQTDRTQRAGLSWFCFRYSAINGNNSKSTFFLLICCYNLSISTNTV